MKYKKTTAVSLVLALVLVCGVTAAFASAPADEKPSLPGNSSVPTDYTRPDGPVGVEKPADVEVTPGDSAIAEGRLMGHGEINYNYSDSNSGNSYFYEDEDGNLVPFDGDNIDTGFVGDESTTHSSTFVLDDTVNSSPVGEVGSQVYGYEVIDPEPISLDTLKDILAQQVANGEMTQEEADQALAETQAMLDEAEKNGSEMFIYTDGDGVPLFSATARGNEDSPVAPAADTTPTADANVYDAELVFLSSMGCADMNCTNPAHYHSCDASCTDAGHYHTCVTGCDIAEHHHSSAAGYEDSHHSSDHHNHHS